jgi:hypothetical protein
MKKVYLFSVIICILLLTALAFTSFKKNERSRRNDTRTNIVNQGNEWFQYDFTVIHVLTGAEIQYRKSLTEAWYTDYLRANERNRHDIAFVWERVGSERLVYRLRAFITPPPGFKTSTSGGVTTNKPDPPSPPAPPPPETTW